MQKQQHSNADVKNSIIGLVICAPLLTNVMIKLKVLVDVSVPFLQLGFTASHCQVGA